MTRIHTSEVLELVGVDERIDQNDYTPDVPFTLRPPDSSGQILGINLITRRGATGGVILTPAGTILVFDVSPAISTGDTALVTGFHDNILGTVTVATGDWFADVGGGVVYKPALIPYYTLKTLYFAFFWADAASINGATGDQETLEMIANYRVEDKFL